LYIAQFAQGLEPLDITHDHFVEEAICTARDQGGEVKPAIRCQSRNLLINGLRLHVLDWGEPNKPTLVLLHGGAVTCRTWGPFCTLLAHKYRLVAVDMRGHGDSEWPRDGDSNHNAMADDLAKLITTMELDNPIVVGHSVGGMLLMRVMLKAPELLGSAVLVDVGPKTAYNGWKARKDVTEPSRLYDEIEEYVQRNAPRLKRSEEHMRRNGRHELMQRADGKYQLKYDPRHPMGGPDEKTMPGLPTLEQMAAYQGRCLVVRGGNSWFLAADDAVEFVETLPQGELATVPDCEHMVYTENPVGLATVIDTYVNSLKIATEPVA
jgi:pimeloyl-ACP methyl ester carboxylesterase|tara:strand:- start:1997 stop:2962 length:966 start_codon:yes stop_codon:yes gene_type:complete